MDSVGTLEERIQLIVHACADREHAPWFGVWRRATERLDHSRIDGLTLPALPLSFDGERALHPSAPPDVGQHSTEILREVGYADEEIAALAADGVIRA